MSHLLWNIILFSFFFFFPPCQHSQGIQDLVRLASIILIHWNQSLHVQSVMVIPIVRAKIHSGWCAKSLSYFQKSLNKNTLLVCGSPVYSVINLHPKWKHMNSFYQKPLHLRYVIHRKSSSTDASEMWTNGRKYIHFRADRIFLFVWFWYTINTHFCVVVCVRQPTDEQECPKFISGTS